MQLLFQIIIVAKKKEVSHMIKKIAWNTFKNTGDINAFIELKQIENIEQKIENITDETKNININENNNQQEVNKINGKYENKWSYII